MSFDVNDLFLNPDNPRTITETNLKKLQDSILRDPEFMRLRPLVINKDNVVIAGNQRLKAIIALEYHSIPDEWVVRGDNLTPEQIERFALIDNSPSGISGEWDWGALTEKLNDLKAHFDFDPSHLGFDNMTFQPSEPPTAGGGEVTAEDVTKSQEQLDQQFQDREPSGEDEIVTLACPHCNEEYGLTKRHLRKLMDK